VLVENTVCHLRSKEAVGGLAFDQELASQHALELHPGVIAMVRREHARRAWMPLTVSELSSRRGVQKTSTRRRSHPAPSCVRRTKRPGCGLGSTAPLGRSP
jgi:hypothetical protein